MPPHGVLRFVLAAPDATSGDRLGREMLVTAIYDLAQRNAALRDSATTSGAIARSCDGGCGRSPENFCYCS
jgi:hypothetical protein